MRYLSGLRPHVLRPTGSLYHSPPGSQLIAGETLSPGPPAITGLYCTAVYSVQSWPLYTRPGWPAGSGAIIIGLGNNPPYKQYTGLDPGPTGVRVPEGGGQALLPASPDP